MKAIQAWRWMRGDVHVKQSYIVRVPDEDAPEELLFLMANTPPGLPPPDYVDLREIPQPPSDDICRVSAAARQLAKDLRRIGVGGAWSEIASAFESFADELAPPPPDG